MQIQFFFEFKYSLLENPTDLKSSLKFFFGFSSFKDLQEPIIENLLSNKNTFVIMPTGGGKSLCYQLPAMVSDGTALVISPLIALMKNQVDAIRGTSTNDGIAHVLNSSLFPSPNFRHLTTRYIFNLPRNRCSDSAPTIFHTSILARVLAASSTP